jgi:hypothetical protein
VPLELMVKAPGAAIDGALVDAAVRALFDAWYMPVAGDYAPAVTDRIAAYVRDGPLAELRTTLARDANPLR